jgi:hypothetical protein
MKVAERTGVSTKRPQRVRRGHRPGVLWPLLVLLGVLSIGGFIGGVSFVTDSTGAGLGAELSWLEEAPVDDFFLPGLFLLGVYGIGCLILMVGLIWRPLPGPLHRLDAWLGHHWSWAGTIAVGAILVGWILYEFVVLPDQMLLQPILIGIGLLTIALPLTPSVHRWYATGPHGN